jgi:hypothetical protein
MPYMQGGRFAAKNISIPVDEIRTVSSGMSMTGKICGGIALFMVVALAKALAKGDSGLSGAEWLGPVLVIFFCLGGVLQAGWRVTVGTERRKYKITGSWTEIESMKEELHNSIGVAS